jgi:pilus assembly protein CpaF
MSFLAHVQRARAERRTGLVEPSMAPPVAVPAPAPVVPQPRRVEPPQPQPVEPPQPPQQPVARSFDWSRESPELRTADPFAELKVRVHTELVSDLGTELLTVDPPYPPSFRQMVERAAEECIIRAEPAMDWPTRTRLAAQIADEVLGFGPLEPLLRDPSISEVIVNGFDQVFVERRGQLEPTACGFRDNEHLIATVQRMIRPVGRRLDLASPMVDARLPDGSRLNAVIPPVALNGPSLTIRKFGRQLLSTDQLVALGALTEQANEFLRACVRGRCNILVSGGTGSGKTTLLNVLSASIQAHERVITIEDPAELRIQQRDWVSLETRPANIEGSGSITQRDLLKNALRMRPDRIIVGECRAGEAFDMLQAMNTGHDGSLTTVHANSPRDALARVQNMVLMAGLDLPLQAIREQIAAGIHLIVHVSRMPDGGRRVTRITEVVGLEESTITLQDLFALETSSDGTTKLAPTGLRPRILERLATSGVTLPLDVFLAA